MISAITGFGHPLVSEVRGRGVMLGVELRAPVSGVVNAALQAEGFLANAVRPNVLRVAPPLILTDEQIEAFLSALPGRWTPPYLLATFDGARHDSSQPVLPAMPAAAIRHFLRDDDLTPSEQETVLRLATTMKAARAAARKDPTQPVARPLAGRAVAVHLREAVDPNPGASFETGIVELGGHPLDPSTAGPRPTSGRGETARRRRESAVPVRQTRS